LSERFVPSNPSAARGAAGGLVGLIFNAWTTSPARDRVARVRPTDYWVQGSDQR